jgi:two-component system response regulator AtoC
MSGNKTKGEICEILGISRPTFERKLEKYGITLELE